MWVDKVLFVVIFEINCNVYNETLKYSVQMLARVQCHSTTTGHRYLCTKFH